MDAGELERLRSAFSAPEPPRGDEPPGASGVLIPLFPSEHGLRVLYTRRSDSLSSHPGEVSFPGGRIDPGDAGPLEAALREAWEEVGIEPRHVDVVGHLTDFTTFRGTLVCAYVGFVEGEPPTEPASRDEVADVFTAPVRTLLAPDHYEGRRVAFDGPADDRVVHYWRLPPATVWGITGELTARFLRAAYGWVPPRPARVIRDLASFMP